MMIFNFSSAMDDERLRDVMKNAFESMANSKNGRKIAFHEGIKELSDAEKIRALALYNFYLDSRLGWGTQSMKWGSGYPSLFVFRDNEIIIEDVSELKKMMESEDDPRKFYLLSVMSSQFVYGMKEDFVKENSRMLFRNEPVSNENSEYTQPFFSNISIYSYDSILANLKILGARFNPPDEEMSHASKALILAKWLKANWPGCENLALPGAGRAVKGGQTRPELPAPPVASTSGPGEGREDPGKSPPRWAWASVLAILAAALVAWFRSRLAKT